MSKIPAGRKIKRIPRDWHPSFKPEMISESREFIDYPYRVTHDLKIAIGDMVEINWPSGKKQHGFITERDGGGIFVKVNDSESPLILTLGLYELMRYYIPF